MAGQTPLSRTAGTGKSTEEDQPATVRLVLQPAGEPRQALKYQLLPPLLDRRPGNAAIMYNKIAMMQYFEDWHQAEDKAVDWLDVPLADFPREEVKDFLARYEQMLDDLDLAARRKDCDWQLPFEERDFVSMLLPEVQRIRSFARLLALLAGLQIAEGRFDEAIRTLQTGYSMGRHIAEGPTLVNGLVGIAVCDIMSERVQELIQQPGAPNLYWALTSLPRPMIDMRKAAETEMNMIYLSFPQVRELDDTRHGREYWDEFVDDLSERIVEFGMGSRTPKWQARLLLTGLAIRGYPMARQYLIDQGRSAEEVDAMPVAQVVAIYSLDTYNEFRDATFKWFFVPYWEAHVGLQEAEGRLGAEAHRREVFPVASLLLPAVGAVDLAVARNDRQIAALRTIEALRIYGAAHDGKLPPTLGDVTEVPVPIDPVHGKPFRYALEGDTAVLESPAPPNRSQKRYGLRFEITFAK
ncbi:MAG TPA: hypothetical protein VMY42_05945 [Thermoguttaceae bacterium]|nr:hypothetical protein [Thermoguttaceae bacterium]